MAQRSRRQLSALTGIRFIAAMWIVTHHFGRHYFVAGPEWTRNLVANGYVLVDLFFLLSGFVIAYTYLDPLHWVLIDRRSFWAARFARIYPVYLFSLIPLVAVYTGLRPMGIASPFSPLGIGAYVFMLQAWLPSRIAVDSPEIPNFPAWAVSVEAFFYLVFPFIARRLSTLSRYHLIAAVLLLTVLNSAALALISVSSGRDTPFSPVWIMPEFLVGIALGKLYLEHEDQPGMPGAAYTVFIVAASLVAVIGIFITMALTVNYVLLAGIVVPLFALLIYCLAHGSGPVATLLGHPVFVVLGQASYCIYLLQDPMIRWAHRATYKWPFLDPASPFFFLVYVAGLVLVSSMVYILIEVPARRLIRAWFAKPTAKATGNPKLAK